MRLLELARTIVRHDWITARQVRRYWRQRYETHHRQSNLPCYWCVHDNDDPTQPVWLWCVRPTLNPRNQSHPNGCDWGNN